MIPIPIPIGSTHVTYVQGYVWRQICCERCRTEYAFLLRLEGRGSAENVLFLDGKGASELARKKAEENLARKGEAMVVPVPCPKCGTYQADMVRRLKDDNMMNPLQVAGAVVLSAAIFAGLFDSPFRWVITGALAIIGTVLLVYGYRLSFRYDPNRGDAERRKAIGAECSVWGEELERVRREAKLPIVSQSPDQRIVAG
jgi:hypothetical protein